MFETIFSQYALICFAVLVVLGIKFYTVNKSYNNQLTAFVNPSLLVEEVKKKLKKIPDSDPRIILAQNLTSMKQDPSRIRNVAILLAVMKSERVNTDPFVKRIKK